MGAIQRAPSLQEETTVLGSGLAMLVLSEKLRSSLPKPCSEPSESSSKGSLSLLSDSKGTPLQKETTWRSLLSSSGRKRSWARWQGGATAKGSNLEVHCRWRRPSHWWDCSHTRHHYLTLYCRPRSKIHQRFVPGEKRFEERENNVDPWMVQKDL